MIVVRNAGEDDAAPIFDLASGIGAGMTTLKADRAVLKARLALSAASFAGEVAPSEADYLFVLEDLAQRRIGGVCAIKGAVGVSEPFYNYRISSSVHTSPAIGRSSRMESLHLSHDLSGAAELCSLYLHPDYRRNGNGRLLSKSRFLFLAQFPALFPRKVFAEMRGFQNEKGESPFWESVGRPFFQMAFHEADDRCGMGDRLFIEQLVPRLPMYTHLLAEEARAVIGKTHVDTVPAQRLLEQEGLHFDGFIDIFDGGPVLEAQVSSLRAVRDSRIQLLDTAGAAGPVNCLVATTQRDRFRVILADGDPGAVKISLNRSQRDALGGERGMPVRVLALNG